MSKYLALPWELAALEREGDHLDSLAAVYTPPRCRRVRSVGVTPPLSAQVRLLQFLKLAKIGWLPLLLGSHVVASLLIQLDPVGFQLPALLISS